MTRFKNFLLLFLPTIALGASPATKSCCYSFTSRYVDSAMGWIVNITGGHSDAIDPAVRVKSVVTFPYGYTLADVQYWPDIKTGLTRCEKSENMLSYDCTTNGTQIAVAFKVIDSPDDSPVPENVNVWQLSCPVAATCPNYYDLYGDKPGFGLTTKVSLGPLGTLEFWKWLIIGIAIIASTAFIIWYIIRYRRHQREKLLGNPAEGRDDKIMMRLSVAGNDSMLAPANDLENLKRKLTVEERLALIESKNRNQQQQDELAIVIGSPVSPHSQGNDLRHRGASPSSADSDRPLSMLKLQDTKAKEKEADIASLSSYGSTIRPKKNRKKKNKDSSAPSSAVTVKFFNDDDLPLSKLSMMGSSGENSGGMVNNTVKDDDDDKPLHMLKQSQDGDDDDRPLSMLR